MPYSKQFESVTLTFPPKIKMLSMVEISEIYYQNIQSIYKYLDQDKQVVIEVPSQDRMFTLVRIESDHYGIKEIGGEKPLYYSFLANEFVNWIFEIAPRISIVGFDNSEF
jgi:hypothetical protein